ncbi:hypothetical protein ACFZA9_06395 [Streptomyces olivaceus]|uniref:hypothetical protein n=1 Tax=Streptomyces olivaceus TaxID=47716 RepID=UPI0036EB7486
MLADDCSPQHTASLTEALGYAHGYAQELHTMLSSGEADAERADQLVNALGEMLTVAADELTPLDDAQAHADAVAEIHSLSDADLFRAITTSGHP